MKGDSVVVNYTTTGGADLTETFTVERNGRKLVIEEPTARDTWFIVTELTRSGRPARKLRVRATQVTSILTEMNEDDG